MKKFTRHHYSKTLSRPHIVAISISNNGETLWGMVIPNAMNQHGYSFIKCTEIMMDGITPEKMSQKNEKNRTSPLSRKLSGVFGRRSVSPTADKTARQAIHLDPPYATFPRQRRVAALGLPPVADYFKVPERLRYDLERLYPDAQSLENLVRNIKASAESMFYDEQARGVSFKTDKTVNVCQQFYLTRLCNRPENRFSKNDLPLLVRLLPAVKEFDQRPLLLPLMGSIAHVFVAEMAELHDLSREELDVMRKKDSSPEQRKLGDILAYRIAYLCADSTSEEVLKTILATPEIINHIGPSCLRFRQEQIKKMKKFSDLVGDGILPRVRVTCQVRGMFLCLIDNLARSKDDFEVASIMMKAKCLLAASQDVGGPSALA